MKRILAIDGGGVRGVIPAMLLAELEAQSGKPVSELFDLVVGASTGGILALGLVAPDPKDMTKPRYTAEQFLGFYKEESHEIFNKSLFFKITRGIFTSRYQAMALEKALKKYFGSTMLSEAIVHVVVPSYELHGRFTAFFKSRDILTKKIERDVMMRDVARAASAAPTYFIPKKIKAYPKASFIDGGVFANNPAMCAYADAKEIFPDEELLIVSLGTGNPQLTIQFEKFRTWGLLGWAKPLWYILLDGSSDVVDYQLKFVLPNREESQRYYRFQIELLQPGTEKLDDGSAENINALIKLGQELLDTRREDILKLCKQLVE
ncbi:patatin-like phospholipase family protein [Planococcus halocryophilus]|uniref:patatin-like phospholipase family protein n=1 Tax=Planococcus halocryophilus TaxID=1215089 RepID=UPI001F1136C0|nr:patatin-like phospholipase family protein [Planococcus halocryophilus]MCH4826813.1 patatin-like phospholipase family protein [Planococcus halocryophilus]